MLQRIAEQVRDRNAHAHAVLGGVLHLRANTVENSTELGELLVFCFELRMQVYYSSQAVLLLTGSRWSTACSGANLAFEVG
jgi:hypothetical protein